MKGNGEVGEWGNAREWGGARREAGGGSVFVLNSDLSD